MQGEETPKWYHAPFATPLDVNWRQEGDEWLHHLWIALGEEAELTGHGMSTQEASPEFPAAHYVFTPTSTQLRSRLRLVPLERGLLFVISGTDDPEAAEPSQIQPWARAAEEASRRIGQRHQAFDWVAVIGALGGVESNSKALATEAGVGSLRFYPSEHYVTEHMASSQPSISARSSFWWWPIIIEGQATGYNWPVAATAAVRNVHRLAALLSVAWWGCWTLRESPRERVEGQSLEIPERPWWDARSDVPEQGQTGGFERQPAPDWLNQAWDALNADPITEDALLVHHEGLVLQQEGHESMAMIAFVSSIEAIGAKLGRLKRCPECNTMIGSAERFRRALALVMPDENERKALAKLVYGRRSTTAHAGRLHGAETAAGTLLWGSFLSVDEAFHFKMHLYAIRKASRDLLLLVLRDWDEGRRKDDSR
jgi:hypothetical protein